MAKKDRLDTTALDTYGSESAAVEKTSNIHPNSLENLHPREENPKKETRFMQLNIIGYEDYLNRMAKHATIIEKNRIAKINRDITKKINEENPTLSTDEKNKLKAQERKKAPVITRTKYILRLIEEDYKKNKELYEQQLKYNEAYGEIED